MENEIDNYEQADNFYRMIEEGFEAIEQEGCEDWRWEERELMADYQAEQWHEAEPDCDDWCDDAAFDSIGWGDDDAY